MKTRLAMSVLAAVGICSASFAQHEYLVRFHSADPAAISSFARENGGRLALVSREGNLYKWVSETRANIAAIERADSSIAYVEPNRPIHLMQSPSLLAARETLLKLAQENKLPANAHEALRNDPDIQQPSSHTSGSDPMLDKAWGIFKVGADTQWSKSPKGTGIVVAVTDTGVDYNHEDLIHNMWRNPGEVAGNGKDDDNNGFVDDVVGWDFAVNDNKPFDITKSLFEILLQGGNPGHGTHVAGVVGASLKNAKGTAGVAPNVRIMAMRFITENGQGSTEAAIKSIDYAVANGAHIINASWGGEKGDEDDKALREAIERAEAKGVIFVAAAGNGRLNQATGKAEGFDNDNDKKPIIPASLDISNIVTVAALDSEDNKAGFSNWGFKSTKIGAPGVKILSTVPGNKYQDTVIELGSIKATWDGTSMAAPFVAGALAVVWSMNPEQSWQQVRDRVLSSATPVASMKGKVATEGRLELRSLR